MDSEQLFIRKQRGKLLAQQGAVQQAGDTWRVRSQTSTGYYIVRTKENALVCTCTDFELRQGPCKHIFAVEFKQEGAEESRIIRKTYSQDWKKYNLSQQKEKEQFLQLLADLTARVQQSPHDIGRPQAPISDVLFSLIAKIYSTVSARRFISDMQAAVEKKLISQKPHYNTLFNYCNKEEITPILTDFVQVTASPLKEIEKTFAIDSTGFGTSVTQHWHKYKHDKELAYKTWIKCHFVTGTQTNIITSVKITSEYDADSPQLEGLVEQTKQYFDMQEVYGDKAYLSKHNLQALTYRGIKPYIPFKATSKPGGNGVLWKKLYHHFQLHHDEFLQHYHHRSNAESTVHMIKAKFGSNLRSKNWTAQINEALCKIICHNICVIIQEMHTRGITPDFCLQTNNPAQETP